MKKHGKKYRAAAEKIEDGRKYDLDGGVAKVKEIAFAKFDETVELTVLLGVDPRKADQLVRGTHAGDTAAQDDNPSRHASPRHDHLVRLLASFGGVTERAGRDTSDHFRRSHEHFQA